MATPCLRVSVFIFKDKKGKVLYCKAHDEQLIPFSPQDTISQALNNQLSWEHKPKLLPNSLKQCLRIGELNIGYSTCPNSSEVVRYRYKINDFTELVDISEYFIPGDTTLQTIHNSASKKWSLLGEDSLQEPVKFLEKNYKLTAKIHIFQQESQICYVYEVITSNHSYKVLIMGENETLKQIITEGINWDTIKTIPVFNEFNLLGVIDLYRKKSEISPTFSIMIRDNRGNLVTQTKVGKDILIRDLNEIVTYSFKLSNTTIMAPIDVLLGNSYIEQPLVNNVNAFNMQAL